MAFCINMIKKNIKHLLIPQSFSKLFATKTQIVLTLKINY